MSKLEDEPAKPSYDRAHRLFWKLYQKYAENHDKKLVQSWNGSMSGILIFSGLFTASVTALIVESYKRLVSDDSVEAMVNLTAAMDRSAGLTPLPVEKFHVRISDLAANILFFLSLGCGLACALSATMVDQWARHYFQEAHSGNAVANGRIRAVMHYGMDVFEMKTIAETIPLLLHVALLLFFAGLVSFFYVVNAVITWLCLAMLLVWVGVYSVATFAPIFVDHSPYRTPLTTIFRKLILQIPFFSRRLPQDSISSQRVCHHGTVCDARCLGIRVDEQACAWLFDACRHDGELESILELLPSLWQYESRHSYARQLVKVFEDPKLQMGSRVLTLLATCVDYPDAPHPLEEPQRLSRARTCLSALHAIFGGAFDGCGVTFPRYKEEYSWFDFNIAFDGIKSISIPEVEGIKRRVIVQIVAKVIVELCSLLQDIQLLMGDAPPHKLPPDLAGIPPKQKNQAICEYLQRMGAIVPSVTPTSFVQDMLQVLPTLGFPGTFASLQSTWMAARQILSHLETPGAKASEQSVSIVLAYAKDTFHALLIEDTFTTLRATQLPGSSSNFLVSQAETMTIIWAKGSRLLPIQASQMDGLLRYLQKISFTTVDLQVIIEDLERKVASMSECSAREFMQEVEESLKRVMRTDGVVARPRRGSNTSARTMVGGTPERVL